MIRVRVEVDAGTVPERVAVQAESIHQAVSTVRGRYPGREVRVVFPIDSEEFFIEGWESTDENRRALRDPFTEA